MFDSISSDLYNGWIYHKFEIGIIIIVAFIVLKYGFEAIKDVLKWFNKSKDKPNG